MLCLSEFALNVDVSNGMIRFPILCVIFNNSLVRFIFLTSLTSFFSIVLKCVSPFYRILHEKREASDAIELLKLFARHHDLSIDMPHQPQSKSKHTCAVHAPVLIASASTTSSSESSVVLSQQLQSLDTAAAATPSADKQ